VTIPVEIKALRQLMDKVLADRLNKLHDLGLIPTSKRLSKREMLDLQARLQSKLRSFPDQNLYQGISILAEIFKVSHAIEIAETQGVSALEKYFERLTNEALSKSGSKAAKRLMDDLNMRQAVHHLAGCDGNNPKLGIVKDLLKKQVAASTAVARDSFLPITGITAETCNQRPERSAGCKTRALCGTGKQVQKDAGLTQKQQVEILQKFREGEYNTLVATSVAEEGLDIPATESCGFL